MTRQPALHGDDEQLGRLVLRLDEPVGDVVEHADPQRPVAVGGVGELGAAHGAHDHENTRTPALRMLSVVVSLPEHPRGHDEVRLVVDEGLEHDRDLGRVVLAVGVEGDHVLRAQLDAERVADPQRVAVARGSRCSTKVTAPESLATWSVLSLAAVDDDERGDGAGRRPRAGMAARTAPMLSSSS